MNRSCNAGLACASSCAAVFETCLASWACLSGGSSFLGVGQRVGRCRQQFECDQLSVEGPVPNQFDAPIDLLNGILVVLVETPCNAEQPRIHPVNLRLVDWERFHHQEFELGFVIQQPVEVEQALVDDIFIPRPLVFEDDRRAVLVDTDRVDSPLMFPSRRVLRGQELERRRMSPCWPR